MKKKPVSDETFTDISFSLLFFKCTKPSLQKHTIVFNISSRIKARKTTDTVEGYRQNLSQRFFGKLIKLYFWQKLLQNFIMFSFQVDVVLKIF